MASNSFDTSAFLDRAVSEAMLTAHDVAELTDTAAQRDMPIGQLCIELGRLSPIQVEAIEGLLDSQSIAKGFEISGLLGFGGTGIVYRARQPSLDRVVAIKTISMSRLGAARSAAKSNAIARFEQEAVTTAKLKHPNIVSAYDFGTAGNRIFLAMEYVDGKDLDSYISSVGRVHELTAWRIAKQVASALAHALELGIVHRDIKPGNLLLTDPPVGFPIAKGAPFVKVTDFGLARLVSSANDNPDSRLTLAGSTIGTPHYMAPEQIEDANVSYRADIYALGATVFHMISGKPPLADLPLMKMIGEKMIGKGAPLDQLPGETSDSGRELLRDMMEHNPSDRVESYEDLIARIDAILQGALSEKSDTVVTESSLTEHHTKNDSQLYPTLDMETAKRSFPIGKLSIGISVVVLLSLIAFSMFQYWGVESPPERMYFESKSNNAIRPLYRGLTLDGWVGVERASNSGEFAGMLHVLENGRVLLEDSLNELPDSDHFGFGMRLAVPEGQTVEVWYDVESNGAIKVVRVEHDQITIGRKPSESEAFVPTREPRRLTQSSVSPFPVLRIDRDEKHWLIGQLLSGEPPPPRLLDWDDVSDSLPTHLRFRAYGDSIYIGEVEVVALESTNQE